MTPTRSIDATHYLLAAILDRAKVESFDRYPFSLPAVRNLDRIEMHPGVTFLIGENGSGKSTLLEAIATAWGFNPEGGSRNFSFRTRESHSDLHAAIRLERGVRRARTGFFLRAESLYNVATEVDRLATLPGPPLLRAYGGKSLHEQSHGESFMALLLDRFTGGGFYVLDEPESALSPTRQLALLVRLHDLVSDGAQFLIATHSPIPLAYPGATIYSLDQDGLRITTYEDTEHYQITRRFLIDPEAMLRNLLDPQ
jgi:predicted ATPase